MTPRQPRRRGRQRSATPGLPRLEEVAVLALAANRGARALSVDEITEPLRAALARRGERRPSTPVTRGVAWIDRLLRCPLCIGWWVSLAVSAAVPGRHRVLRGAAVAGAQTMLALTERLVSEEGRAAIHVADREQRDLEPTSMRTP